MALIRLGGELMSAGGTRWLAPAVACVITVVWTVSFAADLMFKSYDPHPSITPLMLTTAGYLFGGEVVGKIRKTNGVDA